MTATVDTVGGIVRVTNDGAPAEWRSELVVRIGATDGGPAEFGRIRSLIADAAGNVYVADNIAQEIRVFARDGRHLRTIGRRGAGPGEFGDLYSLAWLDGRLAAMDPRNARIGVLSLEGEWIEGVQYFPITGPPSLIRLYPLGDDGFYAPVIEPGSQRLPFVRTTSTGVHDTIAYPQGPGSGIATGVLCRRTDGGITSISMPQSPGIVYGFPPPGGQVAVAWTEHYRIALLDPAGDTVRVTTGARQPLAYSDSLWREGMRPLEELHERFPGSECEPSEPGRPRQRAALRHIGFDDAGRMWVEAATAAGFAWDVYDREWRLLGTTGAIPRSTNTPPYFRDGYLYQVELDELDVPHVVVYRIDGLEE